MGFERSEKPVLSILDFMPIFKFACRWAVSKKFETG
ncbi:hypothetical protein ACUXQR_002446 [Staphylococcus epidermidis]